MEMRSKLADSAVAPPILNELQVISPGAQNGETQPREVVRCACCSLVQFRTQSERCRRCRRPLPLTPAMTLEEAAPEPLTRNQTDSVSADSTAMGNYSLLATEERRWEIALANMIRIWRLCLRQTQREMAKRAALPRTYISRIEHSELVPGPAVVDRIAKALGIALRDLLPPALPEASNGHPDPFWTALLLDFVQLEPRQMTAIVSSARALVIARKADGAGRGHFHGTRQRGVA